MSIYRLQRDSSKYGHTIYYARKWGLPGVECSVCGTTWATTGLEYPTVDLSKFHAEREYREPRAEPLEEWLRLRDQLSGFLPDHIPIKPGLCLGPSTGKATGTLRDFAWQVNFTCYTSRDTYANLLSLGVRMPPAGATEFKLRPGKRDPDLLELELPPRVPLTDDCFVVKGNRCQVCGYQDIEWTTQIKIRGADIPDDCDVFRVSNHTTIILATERFVAAVRQLGLVSIEMHEIEVL